MTTATDSGLWIARGLSLPLDAVTQTFGILARKGAGKTYTANVMAEELIGHGLPVVIIDPLGAFWGLRSSADGERPGLPVTILGGDHGDVPLESAAGKVIAELVVEQPGAYILDLSAFESNAAQDRFVADFAERLYRLKAKHRDPLHLIVDEADSFAPQRPMPGQQRMLGAFEAIVRRGRIRGLGVTLITQRPAVLNKNVLTQIECLVVLQITAPQDRKAIDEWVAGNGTREQRDELEASLASLQRGEAWFWSPAWLQVFTRVQVRERQTFDSSKTPEPGEIVTPKRMAKVDLDELRERMAATIAKAESEDPKKLNARIRELERQLASVPAPEKIVERVEVPVLNGELKRLEEVVSTLAVVGGELAKVGVNIGGIAKEIVGVGDDLIGALRKVGGTPAPRVIERPSAGLPVLARPRPEPRMIEQDLPSSDGIRALGKAERSVLSVLAQYTNGLTRGPLTIMSGYSYSGGFRNTLSALRTAGYIVGGNEQTMRITDAGLEALGPYDPLPVGRDLLDYWLRDPRLGKAEKAILAFLADRYPESISGEELAPHVGYEYSGGFRNNLSKLRTLGLIEGSNTTGVSASSVFFA